MSDEERELIALPLRFGGLGMQNPVRTSEREFSSSTKITRKLTDHIYSQQLDIANIDMEHAKNEKRKLKSEKEKMYKEKAEQLANSMTPAMKCLFEDAQEKGASVWLSALPIKQLGYSLNKQEFRDALCLRYGWKVTGIPNYCACGSKNSVDHSLICKLEGYVSMRHNSIRDTQGKIMREVLKDVQIEPMLQPIENAEFGRSTTTAENARLDVSERGLWGNFERTFFDVRITHHGAPSNRAKTLPQLYKDNEKEKKRLYNERIVQIEKGSFSPLVFTTSGGMGPDCCAVNRRLATLIADMRKDTYTNVMNHIRTRLRFALLRTTLAAIRGYRGKNSDSRDYNLDNVDFNMIPEISTYESL